MKPKLVKAALLNAIRTLDAQKGKYLRDPGKDFTRNRKLPFSKVIASLLCLPPGSTAKGLLETFRLSSEVPNTSALIQQRAKIKPEAFEALFYHFVKTIPNNVRFHGMRLLAVDGTDLPLPVNKDDPDTYYPNVNGKKPYNLLHVNAMYDLAQQVYLSVAYGRDEKGALVDMIQRSSLAKALVIADRNYESYNLFAHIQEKKWFYLIRVKDSSNGITSGLDLPKTDSFDVPIHLKLTRKHTLPVIELRKDKNHYKFISHSSRFDFLPASSSRDDPPVFYDLRFRVVRFPISDSSFETIITNLDPRSFPPDEIKRLYSLRWGIETSFRDLKYVLGLLSLHSKKAAFIRQEVFAKLTMYNFCEMIALSVTIHCEETRYAYKVNFARVVYVSSLFFLGRIPPPDIESLILRNLSPVRPGRVFPRS